MPSIQIPQSFGFLKDQVVIVTGGSSGIGLATAQLFHDNGATVVIGDIKRPSPDTQSSRWIYCEADVTSWSSLTKLFETAFNIESKIDVVVINAAVSETEDIFKDDLDQQGALAEPELHTLDVNIRAPLLCTKLAAHYFGKSKGKKDNGLGRIVMTGSVAGYLREPVPVPMYQMSKHALLGLLRSMKSNATVSNASINLVAPWLTDTPMMPDFFLKLMASHHIPMNDAKSVARAIAFLSGGTHDGEVVMVAGNQFFEIEKAIHTGRVNWLGEMDGEYERYSKIAQSLRIQSGAKL